MDTQLPFTIHPQPTETTCGPTCLHAIYNYYNDIYPLDKLINEIPSLEDGGTLDVLLACHALRRGYKTTIYTYNLQMFDPTWFKDGIEVDLIGKLRKQLLCKSDHRLRVSTEGYIEYIRLGGELRYRDLSPALIRKYLNRGVPILTGLSATYLHGSAREDIRGEFDDICGSPSGHFVVLYGYKKEEKIVYVAEPFHPNPFSDDCYCQIKIDRVICSVLLGILTYDANILIIERPQAKDAKPYSSQ